MTSILNNNKMRIRYAVWVLPVLVAIMIFRFSAQPADDSSRLSNGVIQSLISFIERFCGSGKLDADKWLIWLSTPVRKAAHVTEYLILYLSLVFASWKSGFKRGRWIWLSWTITFLYACTDEFHQTFVPGRAGRFTDVLIDCSGALILCLMIGYKKMKTGSV
jgi:VanZ family protein